VKIVPKYFHLSLFFPVDCHNNFIVNAEGISKLLVETGSLISI